MKKPWIAVVISSTLSLSSGLALAQANLDMVVEHGESLYHQQASCWVCHGKEATGLIGPSLLYGPTPAQILEQLINNLQMAVIVQQLKPDNEALIAISLYIRTLAGLPIDDNMAADYRAELAAVRARQETDLIFPKTERDLTVENIQSFDSVLADWQRRSKEGPIGQSYEATVVAKIDPDKWEVVNVGDQQRRRTHLCL